MYPRLWYLTPFPPPKVGLAVDIGALRMPLFAVQPPAPMEANPESDAVVGSPPECCLLRDILCADAGVSALKFNLLGI